MPAQSAVKAPKPAPVTSLDITVSDPAGKPVEGAFVLALPVTGAYLPFGGLAADKIRSTVTGREGKARLESLPPGPWDVTRAIGWWWMLLLPMLTVIVGVAVAACMYSHMWPMILSWVKLWLALIAGIVSIVLYGLRNVVKNRKDAFCIHCGYSLEGLASSGTCPECGRPYLFALVDEYRKDPHFFAERYKSARQLPTRVTAFAAGDGPTPDDGTR